MEGETRMNSIFTHIFFANTISSLDECSQIYLFKKKKIPFARCFGINIIISCQDRSIFGRRRKEGRSTNMFFILSLFPRSFSPRQRNNRATLIQTKDKQIDTHINTHTHTHTHTRLYCYYFLNDRKRTNNIKFKIFRQNSKTEL